MLCVLRQNTTEWLTLPCCVGCTIEPRAAVETFHKWTIPSAMSDNQPRIPAGARASLEPSRLSPKHMIGSSWIPLDLLSAAAVAEPAATSLLSSLFEPGASRLTQLVLTSTLSPEVTIWPWLAPLVTFLGWLLGAVNAVVANYGISIILLAALLRTVLLPVSLYGARQQRSFQQKSRDLAPLLAEIRKRHARDPDKEYSETIALHRQHGLNPTAQLKGCLPLLIQLPLLLALYQLLKTSPELIEESFLWIDDLALPDRLFSLGFSLPYLGDSFNLLPLVMFLAQVDIASSLEAPSKSKSLSKYVFPITMLLLFYPFPAGCMLYWTVGNILQAAEQRIFLRAGKPLATS